MADNPVSDELSIPRVNESPGTSPSVEVPGVDLSGLVAYVTEFGNAAGDPADRVIEVVCRGCGGTTFWMECSEEDGVARRTCTSCKQLAYIGDSEDLWADADAGDAVCPCTRKIFRIVVGYCLDLQDEVTWMIVGAQCESCGQRGVYADWSIDFEPSKGLLNQN